jgi:hypothetical protein
MGITATAVAKRNKLKRNAEWRAIRRTTSDAFKKAEQESRDRYNEFTKLSRMYCKTHPWEFAMWVQKLQKGVMPVAPSAGPQSRMLPTMSIRMLPTVTHIVPPSSSGRRIPTAQEMERSRLSPAPDNALALLGIRLD